MEGPAGQFVVGSRINTFAARTASKFLTDCLWRVETKENIAFLTFDDGPDPETTPALLKALKDHNFKASFFLIGQKAEKYPSLVKQIADDGHAIGNHTFEHGDPWKMTEVDLVFSLTKTQVILEKIIGVVPLIYRPPFGHLTKEARRWTMSKGGKVCMWDLDPSDYRDNSDTDSVQRRIESSMRGGSLILLHDRSGIQINTVSLISKLAQKRPNWSFLAIKPDLV